MTLTVEMKPNIKNYQKLTIKGHKAGLSSDICKIWSVSFMAQHYDDHSYRVLS